MVKVLTIGTFDLPHPGHVKFLERCKKLGDELVVGVNQDEFVERYKGARPILNILERLAMVESYRVVDGVAMNPQNWIGDSVKELLLMAKPEILAIGSDWASKDYYSQIGVSQHDLDKMGIQLVYLPYTKGLSSSDIKKRLKA